MPATDAPAADLPQASKVFTGTYRDSVALMQLSAKLASLTSIFRASALMATPSNLALLREAGLLRRPVQAGPNDLLVVLEGEGEPALEQAMAALTASLEEALGPQPATQAMAESPRSIEMAALAAPQANLVLISVPAEYAAAEAMKALRLGMNVMLFTDNIPVTQEVALKRLATEKRLIVMGPDCGSAIVDGKPLGFANHVRRGEIGCIAASGTGLQHVSCCLDRLGAGVSHALGTGGRDVSEEVGGVTMLAGLRLRAADPATRIIVLISKPPHPAVADRILAAAARAGKPVVVCFIGMQAGAVHGANLHVARTLEEAAALAARLAGHQGSATATAGRTAADVRLGPRQRFIRGLYSGGTLCYEASMLLADAALPVWSNATVRPERRMADVWKSEQHTLLDLGDGVFTRGRPHPMIDFRMRNERIIQEAKDPEVAVILIDVVLGYGAHPDPALELRPAIERAQSLASGEGRSLAFVAFVCGTEGDPQNLPRQEAALRASGVLLAGTNAEAVRLASAIAQRAA
ncbi:MAG TPA: acyl-CoA synthetase FdrA [Burkholderiales bacterium]|nr:acyl-CoA synthetase FdrA [Burkholderiales bacterium]